MAKNKYLGETPVDISTHEKYANYTNKDWALYFIAQYGGIDGAHHKAWVIDQVSQVLLNTPVIVNKASWSDGTTEDRISLGSPSAEYEKWIKDMYGDQEYNPDDLHGIAP